MTKKITDLRKKGIKEKQEKDEFDEEMRRIEEVSKFVHFYNNSGKTISSIKLSEQVPIENY